MFGHNFILNLKIKNPHKKGGFHKTKNGLGSSYNSNF